MDKTKIALVTGLPRSRTAWLANLLTYGPSFCHHDAIRLGVSAASLTKLFESTDAEYVGDSDSGLLAIPYEVDYHFPQAKWVTVHRDLDQAAASYEKHFSKEPYPHIPHPTPELALKSMEWCKKRLGILDAIIPAPRKLVVNYADLDKESTCRDIWNFCIPTMPFNRQRWMMLDTFRVNIIGPKVKVAGDLIEQYKEHVWDLA